MQRRQLFSVLLTSASVAAVGLASLLTLGAPRPAYAQAQVGAAAPAFTATDVNGKRVALADFKGKYVVLEWTNPGCPYVRKHYDSGNLPATQKDAVANGFVWLAINSTETGSGDYLEPAKLAAWLNARQTAATHVLMDEPGTIGLAYGARTTPHLYIINPQGTLVYAGGIDSIATARADDIPKAVNYVRQAVAELKNGQPVSQAQTRAYGCSIKYKS